MGKGTGNINYWGIKIKGGTVLFEIIGIKKKKAVKALKTGKAKLPIKTKIIS